MNQRDLLDKQVSELSIEMAHLRTRFIRSLTWKQYDKWNSQSIGNENWTDIDISKITKDSGKQRYWTRLVDATIEYRVLDKRANFYVVDAA